MSKGSKNIEVQLLIELQSLEKEELKLFHSYNRHGSAEFKLGILYAIQKVIIKQKALRNLK